MAIKKSEARLLFVFGILIFAAATLFILDSIKGKKAKELARQNAARQKLKAYQELIDQKDQWVAKRAHIEQFLPFYSWPISEQDESPKVQTYFRANASAANLEVIKLTPNTPLELGNNLVSLSYEAQVKGAGGDVLLFISRLQSDTKFYDIPTISIVVDRKDPTLATADMIFARYYTLEGEPPFPLDNPEPTTPEPTTPEPAPETAGSVAKETVAEEAEETAKTN